ESGVVRSGRGALARLLARGQVACQAGDLIRVEEQPQLAASPKNVLGTHGPFLLAQVVDFASVQVTAEMLAQRQFTAALAEQLPGPAAVAHRPAGCEVRRQPGMTGEENPRQFRRALAL